MRWSAVFGVAMVAGCAAPAPDFATRQNAEQIPTEAKAPWTPGTCWAEITQTGETRWFQTLCPEDLTESFVASLQRALAARGLFDGAVTGQMDPATTEAMARYQIRMGLASDRVALVTAQRLGLARVTAPTPQTDETLPEDRAQAGLY